jgi:hypothetical protein
MTTMGKLMDLYDQMDRLQFLKPYVAAESLLAKDPQRFADHQKKIEELREKINTEAASISPNNN